MAIYLPVRAILVYSMIQELQTYNKHRVFDSSKFERALIVIYAYQI